MRTSFARATSSSRLLVQERVVLDLVAEHRRDLERLLAGGRRGSWTRRCCASARPRGPCSARSASPRAARPGSASAGAAGRGGRPRAAPATAPRPARPRRPCASSCGTLVVRKISSRGHAALGDPPPDLTLVLVRARGVDLPVADLQRVPHAVRRVLSGHQPRPVSDGRNRGRPSPRSSVSLLMDRVLSHCYAWQPPGRLAQLGERRLDKAEVTGSSPVSPIKRSAFAGLLCLWFETSSIRPLIRGSRLVRPPWLAWHARNSTRGRRSISRCTGHRSVGYVRRDARATSGRARLIVS